MTTSTPKISRRNLMLAGATTAGALVAAAVVAPKTSGEATAPAAPEANDKRDARTGYRLTQHIQRYYDTARV